MTIFQRIGEAIASQGKVTLVAALTPQEEHILTTSGFKKVGTMDLNGTNIDLFEVKVTQVVNAPVPPYNGIRTPYPIIKPYTTDDTYPRKYEQQWPTNYRMYKSGTGTPSDLQYLQYRGSTSLMNSAYSPLSILEDFYFPNNEIGNSVETKSIKIDLSDLPADKALDYADKFKEGFVSKDYTPKVYTNNWTSYHQDYTENRDFRSW